MATMTITGFLLVGLIFSAVDSASIARVSERDLLEALGQVARADSYSFYKDFGKTKVGSYYDKDNNSGGFNATHEFDNDRGKVSGNVNWDDDDNSWWGGVEGHYTSDNGGVYGKVEAGKDGRLKGGVHGSYSSSDGKTNLGGYLNFDDNGNPDVAFSFNSNW